MPSPRDASGRLRRLLSKLREWTLILLCILAIAGLAALGAMAEIGAFALKSWAAARILGRT